MIKEITRLNSFVSSERKNIESEKSRSTMPKPQRKKDNALQKKTIENARDWYDARNMIIHAFTEDGIYSIIYPKDVYQDE